MVQQSNVMTVVSLSNAMIGGVILVLPVLAMRTGYLMIPLATLSTGIVGLYTAMIIVRHLGRSPSMQACIMSHFDQKRIYVLIYCSIVCITTYASLLIYFDLLIKQLQGLLSIKQGYAQGLHLIEQTYLPYFLAILLFSMIITMRKFDFGTSLMGYGIVSIIGYCVFLVWVLFSAPDYVLGSEPHQIRIVPIVDSMFIDMWASLTMAYGVHIVMVPILHDNPRVQQYLFLIKCTFIIGMATYTFISFSVFGIINLSVIGQPQTIEDYFTTKDGSTTWQVQVIEALYTIHLFSAFPEFSIIVKIYIFSILDVLFSHNQNEQSYSIRNWDEQQAQHERFYQRNQQRSAITGRQIVLYGLMVGICLLIRIFNIKLTIFIQINGAVIYFLAVYLVPVCLHFKCIYFSDQIIPILPQTLIAQKQATQQSRKPEPFAQRQSFNACTYKLKYQQFSQWKKCVETGALIGILGFGIFIMVYTLYTMIEGSVQSQPATTDQPLYNIQRFI